jgi:hypothetical protein
MYIYIYIKKKLSFFQAGPIPSPMNHIGTRPEFRQTKTF